MVNLPFAEADLVTGRGDFQGQRLNMLQIGLGTFGTFIQNLIVPDEVYPGVSWLLEACSDASANLAAVGVEPVPEHTDRLRPLLQGLPGAALVQAAVSREERNVEVYAITPECYNKCVQTLPPKELKTFDDLVIFLRNMSCVGQSHPEFLRFSAQLEEQCGVKVETEPIAARAVTYGALARMLRFRGVEVLLIDAEGYDCKILQSMIDHCSQTKGDDEWPEVIQFETMGHSNWMRDSSNHDQEAAMCRTLEGHGYTVACHGTDTQLVREAALASEPRLQRWVRSFRCQRCRTEGREGMPFSTCSSTGILCFGCGSLMHAFGQPVFEWEVLRGRPQLASLSSNGPALWGVDLRGRACCYQDGRLERFGGGLREIAASRSAAEIWGVDEAGGVYRCVQRSSGSWQQLEDSPPLAHIAVAGDGSAVWGTDRQGRVFVRRSAAGRWRRVRGWLRQLSVSYDGRQIWAVNAQGKVFCCYNDKWLDMPGHLRQVAVSGDGGHVWGVNDSNQVFYRRGYSGYWVRVPGALSQVCSAEDSSTVWGTDTSSQVWAFSCS